MEGIIDGKRWRAERSTEALRERWEAVTWRASSRARGEGEVVVVDVEGDGEVVHDGGEGIGRRADIELRSKPSKTKTPRRISKSNTEVRWIQLGSTDISSALGIRIRARKEGTYELIRRVEDLAGEGGGREGAGDVLGCHERGCRRSDERDECRADHLLSFK